MRFIDLKFAPFNNGIRAFTKFGNGYGASVIQSPHSYGSEAGRYELAVMVDYGDSLEVCYDSSLTDDVVGWLAEDDVTDWLGKIEALPSRR